jgi:hypothetical protein
MPPTHVRLKFTGNTSGIDWHHLAKAQVFENKQELTFDNHQSEIRQMIY